MDNQQRNTLEIFKQVASWPSLEVSNFGNVRSSKTKVLRYLGTDKRGYKVVQIKRCGVRHTLKVHRLVAECFLEPPSAELVDKCRGEHWGLVLVKHLDNDKTNNRVDNLEWSDLSGNTSQAYNDGLIPPRKGESNGRAVLSEELVHRICKSFQEGMMPSEAIKVYGVSRSQATKIRAGHQWKHIWEQYDIKVSRRG